MILPILLFDSLSTSELNFETRDSLASANVSMGNVNGDAGGGEGGSMDWEDIEGFDRLPPGEEGIFADNAGMEDEIYQEIIEHVVPSK